MTNSIEQFIPKFPHPHYHSYIVKNGQLADINPVLQQRAIDVLKIVNRLGARTVVDVGSNLGGFLYFLEQFGDFDKLLGIEGDPAFVAECAEVTERLESQVQFLNKTIMQVEPLKRPMDAMILQNIYHYVYDKEGDHELIFEKLGQIAKSIIWYNPMTSEDPVIAKHANSNARTDWGKYNHLEIFYAAIKAGFLHPIRDLSSKFGGMGSIREHWLFIKDEVVPLKYSTIHVSKVCGEKVSIRDHYSQIHEVFLSDKRSYKIFKPEHQHLAENVLKLVELGVLDATVCPGLRFIVDDGKKIVGYSQPRGRGYQEVRNPSNTKEMSDGLQWQRLVLFSRMIRAGVFNHDLGEHNFIMLPGHKFPVVIDLEPFVFNAAENKALSVYGPSHSVNEVKSAEDNLKLLFKDTELSVDESDGISLLRKLMYESLFLNETNFESVLGSVLK